MSFADKLKEARREKGYSQEQLAEKLNVSRQSVTKWETDSAYPQMQTLLLLSFVLGKSLDWLLQDEVETMGTDINNSFIDRGEGLKTEQDNNKTELYKSAQMLCLPNKDTALLLFSAKMIMDRYPDMLPDAQCHQSGDQVFITFSSGMNRVRKITFYQEENGTLHFDYPKKMEMFATYLAMRISQIMRFEKKETDECVTKSPV